MISEWWKKSMQPQCHSFPPETFWKKMLKKIKKQANKKLPREQGTREAGQRGKMLGKTFPSPDKSQLCTESLWEIVTAETSQKEQCAGGTQLIIKPCGICEGSAQKLEAVFWETESALITVLRVILLKCFCSESFSVWGRAMLLCYHFPSLLQASAHSEYVQGQAGPQCLSFQVLFFSLFINSLQEEKNYLGQGFLFLLYFFFFSFGRLGEALCIQYTLLS